MKRIALISFPLALVIAAACQEGVVNPTDDASLVPGPQFAKWTDASGVAGCDANAGVKFQPTRGGGLRVTGTSGVDNVDCSGSDLDITFSGGDGDDTFLGGNGNDHMVGGNGDDDLRGGGGDDTAIGGEHNGGDTCVAETRIGCEIP